MSHYPRAYPQDLTWMDDSFGRAGPLRRLADQVWNVNEWIGGDLYDTVEDWPKIVEPDGKRWENVPTVGAELLPVDDADRMRLHLGFGGTEDEVNALRAKDVRYTLRRN